MQKKWISLHGAEQDLQAECRMQRDSEHILPLEGIWNPRDLGGFPAADGRMIRPHLLLRTGHLGNATDRDVAWLSDVCNLQKIFDFRTVEEIERQPDRAVGQALNIHLPAIDPDAEIQNGSAIPQEAFSDLETHLVYLCFTDGAKLMAKDMYPSLVRSEYTQVQYSAFLRMIVETPDGAVLWHCSQGKDRTGLGAAFILSALGASRETIMEDYLLSAPWYKDIVSRLSDIVRSKGGGKDETDVILSFMGVNPENFSAALDIIDDEYGGMDSYLREQLLLSDEDIATLRERYLA